jgi:hypothetical protein
MSPIHLKLFPAGPAAKGRQSPGSEPVVNDGVVNEGVPGRPSSWRRSIIARAAAIPTSMPPCSSGPSGMAARESS